MSRYTVVFGDKYSCFSGILEDFITDFMTFEEYQKWLKIENPNITDYQHITYEEATKRIFLSNLLDSMSEGGETDDYFKKR